MLTPNTPTSEELGELPRWARVAFAARCARRVLPLLEVTWPAISRAYMEAVEKAVVLAERAAVEGRVDPATAQASVDAMSIAREAGKLGGRVPSVVAGTASHAASAALAPNATGDAVDAADSAYAALVAMSAVRDRDGSEVQGRDGEPIHTDMDYATRAIRTDYLLLASAAEAERWKNDTPVSPDFFGPLWWDEEPDWWPEEPLGLSDSVPVLQLQFSIPAEVPKDEADRIVGEILQRANELHHAMGGTGLTLSDAEVYEFEPERVPVGCGDDDRGGGK